MIKNYLTIALRTLRRQKIYALINVLGLAVGLACFLLIGLFILHERSYDRFHEHADRIVRITEEYYEEGTLVEESASIPFPFGPAFATFADVKTTRFYQTYQKTPLLSYQDQRFYEDRLFFTDSTVFDLFSFPLVQGDPATALDEPFTMVITESAARRYFGEADPMGKVLTFEDALDFRITGVAEDPPLNSHIRFDFLAALQNVAAILGATGNESEWQGWFWNPCHTYALLPPGVQAATVEATLPDFVRTHFPENLHDDVVYSFQALTDIHLHSNLYQEIAPNGSMQAVQLYAIIAVLILLIACINFMNLSTARSLQRALEVGMRKVLGAERGQLIQQFLGESVLVSLFAAVLGAVLAVLLLPAFGDLIGTPMARTMAATPVFVLGVLGIGLLVGVLAGLYPAFVLSGYEPTRALRGGGTTGSSSVAVLRKALVVTQFAISIVLLVSTFVVYQQLRYLQEKDLGFEKEQIVMIPIRGTAVKENVEAFKDEIKRNSSVLHATALSDVVGREVTVRGVIREGNEDEQMGVAGLFADENLAETFGLTIAEGRDLDPAFETDRQAALVNERFVQRVGWSDEALGKWVWFAVENSPNRPVVGIVEDFNFAPLRQTVQPLIIGHDPAWFAYLAVRLAPGDARPTLDAIEQVWNQFEPARPFEPFFLDENLDALYATEARLGQTYGAFALLAIIIACLGLFGLAAYTAQQRTREIGVRKALGASVGSILVLLSRDFVLLVGIAFVLAVPAAYFLLDRWLQGFAYHIEISWPIFLIAGLTALGIALLTVSYQALRAATVNPVEALRVE